MEQNDRVMMNEFVMAWKEVDVGLFQSILHLPEDTVKIQERFRYYSQSSARDLNSRLAEYEVGYT
jgi:hypothetical protein